MSTAIATTEPATAPAFVNPLDLTVEVARVDHAVERYIDSVVGDAEDQIRYMQQRREVACAVRRVHALRQEMSEVVAMAELTGLVLAGMQLDQLKVQMILQFRKFNQTGTDEQIAEAVNALVSAYRGSVEAPKKKGKSSAG